MTLIPVRSNISKRAAMHVSGYTVSISIRMQNFIKIYHVVQEL